MARYWRLYISLQRMELKLRVENVDGFLRELLARMRNLGAQIACNRNSGLMPVNETVPTEEEISTLLASMKALEETSVQDERVQMELMNKYKKVGCLLTSALGRGVLLCHW